MNMPNDGTSKNTEEACSSTATHRAYPEHTLASILLMGLLSAAVLYGVAWSVQVPETIVHAWDFSSLTAAESPWGFPDVRLEQDDDGITFLIMKTGPGPEMVMELDTQTVRLIRVTAEVTHAVSAKPMPFSLEWYWISAEDIAAADGAWPYSTERGVALKVRDRHQPDVHTVDVSRHKLWKGTIAQGFIGIKIPKEYPGPFQVRIKHIEFLE